MVGSPMPLPAQRIESLDESRRGPGIAQARPSGIEPRAPWPYIERHSFPGDPDLVAELDTRI